MHVSLRSEVTHIFGALGVWFTAQSSVGLWCLVWSNVALENFLVVSWEGGGGRLGGGGGGGI